MATLDELLNRREALAKLRAGGSKSLRFGEREETFKTDAEMAAALADLDRQIAAARSGGSPVAVLRFNTSKGL